MTAHAGGAAGERRGGDGNANDYYFITTHSY